MTQNTNLAPQVTAALNLLDAWAETLRDDGKAKRTIDSYTTDVTRFVDYHCAQRGRRLEDATRADVAAFFDSVKECGLKPATVNKVVNSLSCLVQHLAAEGALPADRALVVPKRDRVKLALGSEREVTALTDEQVNDLLSFLEGRSGHRIPQRDRLIVHFLLYTGVRVSELVNVKLAGLDLVVGSVTVTGKGDKLREIPLRPDLADEIRAYIGGERRRSRFAETSQYLFVSQRGPKLERDAVNSVLDRIEALEKFDVRLHPHLLRHTFAGRLVSRGVALTTVQRLAGHASVQTTATYYVHTSRKDKESAVNLL